MSRRTRRWVHAVPLLPLSLGVTDGILTALTLAGGAIIRGADADTASLALRVGVAALVTSAFTMFVADYAERRAHLVRASKQLNMTEPGRLAATSLGRQAAKESTIAMAVAAAASLAGASVPLLVGAMVPGAPWLVLVLAIACLGGLGWALGGLIAAHRSLWAVAMVGGGAVVTLIGVWLDIA
jgi:predicted membrane protein (TIGR00267 family)